MSDLDRKIVRAYPGGDSPELLNFRLDKHKPGSRGVIMWGLDASGCLTVESVVCDDPNMRQALAALQNIIDAIDTEEPAEMVVRCESLALAITIGQGPRLLLEPQADLADRIASRPDLAPRVLPPGFLSSKRTPPRF